MTTATGCRDWSERQLAQAHARWNALGKRVTIAKRDAEQWRQRAFVVAWLGVAGWASTLLLIATVFGRAL